MKNIISIRANYREKSFKRKKISDSKAIINGWLWLIMRSTYIPIDWNKL